MSSLPPSNLVLPQPKLARTINTNGREIILGLKRGMVFWAFVYEEEAVGCEHKHPKDPCPWIVISADRLHNASQLGIAVVLALSSATNKANNYRPLLKAGQDRLDFTNDGTFVSLKGDSVALTDQVKTFCQSRLLDNPVAQLAPDALKIIGNSVKHVLHLI